MSEHQYSRNSITNHGASRGVQVSFFGDFVKGFDASAVEKGSKIVRKETAPNGSVSLRSFPGKTPADVLSNEFSEWESVAINPELASQGTIRMELHRTPSRNPLLKTSEETLIGKWLILTGEAAHAKLAAGGFDTAFGGAS